MPILSISDFKALQEWQTGNKLKILHSDGGGEYLSNEFRDHSADNGIRHVPKGKRSKLALKALKFKLIGYPETKKAYRLWNPIKECIEISRDIIFDETAILNAPPAATIIEDDEYTVEAIIGERHIDGVPQYLVKWLG